MTGHGWLQLGDHFLPPHSIRLIECWWAPDPDQGGARTMHALVCTDVPDGPGLTLRLKLKGVAAELAYAHARRLAQRSSDVTTYGEPTHSQEHSQEHHEQQPD